MAIKCRSLPIGSNILTTAIEKIGKIVIAVVCDSITFVAKVFLSNTEIDNILMKG